MPKKVEVGDIVLLQTEHGDRPLIVTSVKDPQFVRGILLLDGPGDPERRSSGGMASGGVMVFISNAYFGNKLGEWRPKSDE